MSGRSISGLSHASAAFLAAVIFIIFFSAPAFAQRTYYVNGKTVSKSSYDAAFLVQEANDLMAAGNLGRASRKLRLALSYDPDFSVAHTNLGIILARQGKNSEALIHLQKSVKSPEAAPLAYMNLASFYQCTGNLDGSINTFNLLAGKETASSEMKDYAGNILKMLEKERAQRQKSKASSAKGASTPDYFAYAGANATADPP